VASAPNGHPLTGSNEWTERTGIAEISPVWGGKANVVHLNADGPTGHVEMSALRLYNPKARQWSIHFATPQDADLGPPLIGEFKNGRGVFYDQEEFNGRIIWVRFTVFAVSPRGGAVRAGLLGRPGEDLGDEHGHPVHAHRRRARMKGSQRWIRGWPVAGSCTTSTPRCSAPTPGPDPLRFSAGSGPAFIGACSPSFFRRVCS
jgi:hypothetical protein